MHDQNNSVKRRHYYIVETSLIFLGQYSVSLLNF